jgi:putative transposase
MARKLRLEFPGAFDRVINRGNYRRWIFRNDRTMEAIPTCRFDACQHSGWRLHAFAVMSGR